MNREEQLKQVIDQYLAASPEQQAKVPNELMKQVVDEYLSMPRQPIDYDYDKFHQPQQNTVPTGRRTRRANPAAPKTPAQPTTTPQYNPAENMSVAPNMTLDPRWSNTPIITAAPNVTAEDDFNPLYPFGIGVGAPLAYEVLKEGYKRIKEIQEKKKAAERHRKEVQEVKEHLGYKDVEPKQALDNSVKKVVPNQIDNVRGNTVQSKKHLTDTWLDKYNLTNGKTNILPRPLDMTVYNAVNQSLPGNKTVGSYETVLSNPAGTPQIANKNVNKWQKDSMNQIRNNALGEYHKYELGNLVSKQGNIDKRDLDKINFHTDNLNKLGIDINPFATRKVLKSLSHK